jgi:FMN phosphatase YigB (HAD superfamily)
LHRGLLDLLTDDRLRTAVPSPDRYAAMAATFQELGTSPTHTLLLDDSERNIALGNRLGLKTILISAGRSSGTAATLVTTSLTELSSTLNLEMSVV